MHESVDPRAIPANWASYLASFDESPAALLVNLWYEHHAPLPGCGVLHRLQVSMIEPGDNGLGTRREADNFAILEDEINESTKARGFHPVSRMRHQGAWHLAYYADEDCGAELAALSHAVLDDARRDTLRVKVLEDKRWRFFFEVLLPNEQQRQWMRDRDIVQTLLEHGDNLGPRPVEHAARFRERSQAERFANALADQGFATRIHDDDNENDRVQVDATRKDAVALEDIHAISWALLELAKCHGGEYDGWGAPLLSEEDG